MKRTQRIGLTFGLVCVAATAGLAVTHSHDLVLLWKLGSIPKLEIDRVFEDEDRFGDPVTRVELSLTISGSRKLYCLGYGFDPLLGHATREPGGDWESLGFCGTGLSYHAIQTGEKIRLSAFLYGEMEERFHVVLSPTAGDAESVPIYSEVVRPGSSL